MVSQGARFSSDRAHRLGLWRRWGEGGYALWIMLNPSLADDQLDDQTITNVLTITHRAGLRAVEVVNLFSLVEPDSGRLSGAADLVHADVDVSDVKDVATDAERVVVAWGDKGATPAGRRRVVEVLAALDAAGWMPAGAGGGDRILECIGVLGSKMPKHPGRKSLDGVGLERWHLPPSFVFRR